MLLASLAMLTGCGTSIPAQPAAEPAPPSSSSPPSADGSTPPPAPNEQQSREYLQTEASEDAGAAACRPEQLQLRMGTMDVALGHRFSQLVARNASGESCVLAGTPGLGGQAMSGAQLHLVLENRDSVDDSAAGPVALAPQQEAYANVEWTGALAGANADHLARFIVQPSAGQAPIAFLPPGEGAGHPPNHTIPEPYDWEPVGIHDLGDHTTVRIGPWRASR